MRMVKIMAALWGVFFVLMLAIAGCSTKEVQVAEPEDEAQDGSGMSGMSVSAQPQSQPAQQEVVITEEVISEGIPEEEPPVCGDGNCEEPELSSCEEDCPSCDDHNACTSDSFDIQSLKCLNVKVTDCCGDGFCAPDEECSTDCPVKTLALSSYPYPFVHGDEIVVDIILGDEGSSKEISAANAIARGLGVKETIYGTLASDIQTIRNTNVILIGTPCSNPFVAELMPYKDSCLEDYGKGEGRIALFVTGQADEKYTYALVVSGYTDDDTIRAATLLENYESNLPKLKGMQIKV